MPYNSYYPVSYNPYQGYYQPNFQTQFQPIVQTPQTMQNQQQNIQAVQPLQSAQSIIWVSGDKEASMYPIAPNNAVTLWSQSEPVVYLKQADASGKPTMKIYDLVERTETASNANVIEDDNLSAYATKEEVSAIVTAMKSMSDLMSSIKGDIETMRGDLYGIAGKKKAATRRQEVEDDE